MKRLITLIIAGACLPSQASADPGVGDPVYGATVRRGVTEFEARLGRLTGGSANGADGLTIEVEHAYSDRFAAAILVETTREAERQRTVQSASIEAIYTLARVEPLALDIAAYGEYKVGLHDSGDVFEGKLLMQHRAGPFDSRLNLIAEHTLQKGEPVAFSYAASADWGVAGDDLRLGLAAFGDLGSTKTFGGRQQHYAGPILKTEVERVGRGELEIEAGWLRAFGSARDHADGQARLLVSYETRF